MTVTRGARPGVLVLSFVLGLLAVVAFPATAPAGFGFVTKWGIPGQANGEFEFIGDIATDSAGNVYVTDNGPGNDRVQKFSPTGAFITKWGSRDPGPAQMARPEGIDVDAAGNVYVMDAGFGRVKKFTPTGTLITQWGSLGSGDGQFGDFADGLDVDPAGNVYVADSTRDLVHKFTSTGGFLGVIGAQGPAALDRPLSVATGVNPGSSGPHDLYVASDNDDAISKFSAAGSFITSWGSFGTAGEGLHARGLATDTAGSVYAAASSPTDNVQKFSPSGEFLTEWGGSQGVGDGQFRGPAGVHVSSDGSIYVVDSNNNRIQKFHELVITTQLKQTQPVSQLKAKLGCPQELCTLVLTGKVKLSYAKGAGAARKQSFKLKKKAVQLAAGEKKSTRLKLKKNSKSVRKIKRLIKTKRGKAKANLNVRGIEPFREADLTKLKIKKLKR